MWYVCGCVCGGGEEKCVREGEILREIDILLKYKFKNWFNFKVKYYFYVILFKELIVLYRIIEFFI